MCLSLSRPRVLASMALETMVDMAARSREWRSRRQEVRVLEKVSWPKADAEEEGEPDWGALRL